jgi:hypothetical protein
MYTSNEETYMRILYASFDIADQVCKMYTSDEWTAFLQETKQQLCDDWDDEVLSEDDLLETAYGDEFWWARLPGTKEVYAVAFDIRTEEFTVCSGDMECEMYWEVIQAEGAEEEVFWAE